MPPKKKSGPNKPAKKAVLRSPEDQVEEALSWLKKKSSARHYGNLAKFGITTSKAFGVSMTNIQALAKHLGRSHELAALLWDTGWYEARLLTSFVDDPAQVTSAQMDRWCDGFDNWAVCDTLCFHLFDRTPHAWAKVAQWSNKQEEFVKRAAFALLASLAGHDRSASDERFIESLALIERAATDDRNFVKKGVNWALRRIGRRNASLHEATLVVARRLADSPNAAARWNGKDAIRELNSAVVVRQLARLKKKATAAKA